MVIMWLLQCFVAQCEAKKLQIPIYLIFSEWVHKNKYNKEDIHIGKLFVYVVVCKCVCENGFHEVVFKTKTNVFLTFLSIRGFGIVCLYSHLSISRSK